MNFDGALKVRMRHAGPGSVIPDLIRDQDDGSGIQNILKFLDSGVRRNDGKAKKLTFFGFINFSFIISDFRFIPEGNV